MNGTELHLLRQRGCLSAKGIDGKYPTEFVGLF